MTTPGDVTTPFVDGPPDWATFEREIYCPLCKYNLRGLSEPRCPECGHRFSWIDVLDLSRKPPGWFFEYSEKRRLRSLTFTFIRSQLPVRFWRLIKPTYAPTPMRLAIYWTLVIVVSAASGAGWLIRPIAGDYLNIYRYRQRLFADPRIASQPGGAKALVEIAAPYPSLLDELHGRRMFGSQPGLLLPSLTILLGFALWPWLTLLTLQIFQSALQRAGLQPAHYVRCVVYASDVGILLAFPLTMMLEWWGAGTGFSSYRSFNSWVVLEPYPRTLLLACTIILAYRLYIAYRNYLRIPHALPVCIASQCIVTLALATAYIVATV